MCLYVFHSFLSSLCSLLLNKTACIFRKNMLLMTNNLYLCMFLFTLNEDDHLKHLSSIRINGKSLQGSIC